MDSVGGRASGSKTGGDLEIDDPGSSAPETRSGADFDSDPAACGSGTGTLGNCPGSGDQEDVDPTRRPRRRYRCRRPPPSSPVCKLGATCSPHLDQ